MARPRVAVAVALSAGAVMLDRRILFNMLKKVAVRAVKLL